MGAKLKHNRKVMGIIESIIGNLLGIANKKLKSIFYSLKNLIFQGGCYNKTDIGRK